MSQRRSILLLIGKEKFPRPLFPITRKWFKEFLQCPLPPANVKYSRADFHSAKYESLLILCNPPAQDYNSNYSFTIFDIEFNS